MEDKKEMRAEMTRESKSKRFLEKKGCPFLKEEHEECYSADLNVHTMVQAIHYCLGNYKVCDVYIKLKENEKANR